MATIQIRHEKKYAKAIGLLYNMGGMFRTKPTQQLVVGPFQMAVLREAGLLPKPAGPTKRQRKVGADASRRG